MQGNIKYCWKHGHTLDENLYCYECKESFEKHWENHPNPPKDLGKHSNYLLKELEKEINKLPLSERYWIRNKAKTSMNHIYPCHNCKYYNHHQINYCPKCGNSIRIEKLTTEELTEKYNNYKTGW